MSNSTICNLLDISNKKVVFLTKLKSTKRVTKRMIYRSVASSTAIETGDAVLNIERKLKSNRSKFGYLALAS